MFRNRLIQRGMSGSSASSASSSYWSTLNDETEDDTFSLEEIKTRLVWVTNYDTDEDFPINVPIEDPLEKYFTHSSPIDLSKLTLNELLILLYHFQQRQEKPTNISLEKPSSEDRPTNLSRRFSALCLSNLADAPKHLTPTLIQSLSSVHVPTNRPIHSPNDVVTKLEQTLRMHENQQKCVESKFRRVPSSSSTYSYHQCQEHKAKVISKLLSSPLYHR